MALRRMPNGEVVDVPDNIAPEALQRIENSYKRQARRDARSQPSSISSEQREVNKRVEQHDHGDTWREHTGIGPLDALGDYLTPVAQGIAHSIPFADRIAAGLRAGTVGTANAIRKGDIGEIGKEYRISKATTDAEYQNAQNNAPARTFAGEMGGAVATLPLLGTGARGVEAAGAGAERIGMSRAASALRGTARQMEAGPVRSAIAAGASQGALNSASHAHSVSDMPEAAVEGATVGGLTGGLLGGGANVLRRGVQIINDARPVNASRTALAKIADMLDKSSAGVQGPPTASGVRPGISPAAARAEIAATDAAGGDAMVMDMSPRLRARAAAISRNISVPSSDAMIERAGARIGDRNSRFAANATDRAGLPVSGDDMAYAHSQDITAARKAAGQHDYAQGGPMDNPVKWTPSLGEYLAKNPDIDGIAKRAYKTAERFGEDIAGAVHTAPDGTVHIIPSMRAFDYIKGEYDDIIGKLLKSGKNRAAASYSNQLEQLKAHLLEANPEYGAVLETQRDAFRKVRAVELGDNAMQRMSTNPRGLLRELQTLDPKDKLDARIGIVDAITSMDTKADPVNFIQSVMRNKAQRKVLEFAFGGEKKFGDFAKWVTREGRAREADKLVAAGRQSETSRIHMADEEGGITAGIPAAAGRGFGFGGITGAVGNVWAKVQSLARGESLAVQDEIAKILMSKGEGLEDGVAAVKQYTKRRERSNKRMAQILSKAGQQGYTSLVGGS